MTNVPPNDIISVETLQKKYLPGLHRVFKEDMQIIDRNCLVPIVVINMNRGVAMKQSLGMGGSTTTKNLLNGVGELRWCVREESKHEVDNGWIFLSDQDTEEYLADINNWVICDFGTIVEIEPAVLEIFDFPVGTELLFAIEEGHKCFVDMEEEKLVLAIPLDEKKEERVKVAESMDQVSKPRRNWLKWWKK